MASSATDNLWVELRNDGDIQFIQDAYGVHENRYIVFNARIGGALMYDIQTQSFETLPRQIPWGYVSSCILKGVLYRFDRNSRTHCLNLSPMSEWKNYGPFLGVYPTAVVCTETSIYTINALCKIHCYDTITNKPREIARIPIPVVTYIATAVANRIYIIGGSTKSTHKAVATVQVFDINSQTWSQAPPFPKTIRQAAVTTFVDRWIIVTGGRTHFPGDPDNENNSKIYVFDTLSQKWSESQVQLSPPRITPQCLTIGSHMICVGGQFCGSHGWCPAQAIEIKHIIPDWNYEHIRRFILMRKLVDEGRATPINVHKRRKTNTPSKTYKLIQTLIVGLGWDMFRHVLSFLIHPKSELRSLSSHDWRNCLCANVDVDVTHDDDSASSEEDEEDEGSYNISENMFLHAYDLHDLNDEEEFDFSNAYGMYYFGF